MKKTSSYTTLELPKSTSFKFVFISKGTKNSLTFFYINFHERLKEEDLVRDGQFKATGVGKLTSNV